MGTALSVRFGICAVAATAALALASAPASAAPSQLRAGDSGNAVRCLQYGLNLWSTGFDQSNYPIPQTGYFGSATTSAVNRFKSVHELAPNGVFGTGAGNTLRQYIWAYRDRYAYADDWWRSCNTAIPHT